MSSRVDMSLIKLEPIRMAAAAMQEPVDSGRYTRDDWIEANSSDDDLAAILRHLTEWQSGVLEDADSGLHPVAHVLARAMCVVYREACLGPGEVVRDAKPDEPIKFIFQYDPISQSTSAGSDRDCPTPAASSEPNSSRPDRNTGWSVDLDGSTDPEQCSPTAPEESSPDESRCRNGWSRFLRSTGLLSRPADTKHPDT